MKAQICLAWFAVPNLLLRAFACLVLGAAALAHSTDGTLDPSFDPGNGPNDLPQTILSLPNGQILVGGEFTAFDGVPRSGLARLNADGTVDQSFRAPDLVRDVTNALVQVQSLALQPDGKILVGGDFTLPGKGLLRLTASGALDQSFDPTAGVAGQPPYGGPQGYAIISAIAVAPDGKILIGGDFYRANNVPRRSMARLNADGTLDTAFNARLGGNILNDSRVQAILLEPDGKILLGGWFGTVQGRTRQSLARLNADGTLDETFNWPASDYRPILSLALLPNGKILVGGQHLDGISRGLLVRLRSDGSRDPDFPTVLGRSGGDHYAPDSVFSLVVQADGRILVGGWLHEVNGIARSGIARLTSEGAVDTTFDPGAGVQAGTNTGPPEYIDNTQVYAIALSASNQILVGGDFHWFNGTERRSLAQLTNFEPPRMSHPRMRSDGTFVVSFQSVYGTDYTLQSTSDLSSGSWSPIGNSVTGDGRVMSITGETAAQPAQFYRLLSE